MALNKSFILPVNIILHNYLLHGDKGLNVFDQQWNFLKYKDI